MCKDDGGRVLIIPDKKLPAKEGTLGHLEDLIDESLEEMKQAKKTLQDSPKEIEDMKRLLDQALEECPGDKK
jgi:hypothetical protein